MTRIILHPSTLPRFPTGPFELHGDWHWWRCGFADDILQRWEPSMSNVEEATVEFNRDIDPDTEIVDPPVMRVLTLNRTTDIGFNRTFMESRSREVLIVWYGSPGERWQQLPGNTCRPGEYEVVELLNDDQRRGSWSDAYEARFAMDQPRLSWPPIRAVQRRPLTVSEAENMLSEMDENGRPQVYQGQLDDTLLAFQRAVQAGDLTSRSVGAGSWARPARAPAPTDSLNGWMRQIAEARSNFETANRERPRAILMSPGDMEQLRRLAQRFEDFTPPGRGVTPSPLGSVMGLEIIADRNIPPGEIYIVGRYLSPMPPPGTPFEVQLTPPPRTRIPSSDRGRRIPPQTARVRENDDGSRSYTFDAVNGTYDGVVFSDGTEVDFQSVTMSAPGEVTVRIEASGRTIPPGQPRLRPAAGVGWGNPARRPGQRPDEVLAWGGDIVSVGRPVLPANRNVLPESQVVDEIDRLVNDQVRPGPVDDYNANRYPECKECGHDWHGLDCEDDGCDCINTDWLGPDQRTKHLDFDPTPLEIQRPEGTRIRNLDLD